MADTQVAVYVGKQIHDSGKVVNVYDTYAHALDHAATGLATIKTLNPLDGTGDAITQEAKVTGITVDQFGMMHFVIDDGTLEVFIMCTDHFGAPRKVIVTAGS